MSWHNWKIDMDIINTLVSFVRNLLDKLFKSPMPPVPPPPPEPPEPPPVVRPAPPVPPPASLWDTPEHARHSCRVIMDEEGLTPKEKDILCRVINAESGFHITAKNLNKDDTGRVLSTDYGICQINDYWNIGPGKPFASVEEVLTKPEKSVRFMISMYKAGKLKLWAAYSTGAYLNYSA